MNNLVKSFFCVSISVGFFAAACSDDVTSDSTPDAATTNDSAASDSSTTNDSATNQDTSTGPALSTDCANLPVTVTLGETIDPTASSAILCFNAATGACRFTTYTYSEGSDACPTADTLVVFTERASGNSAGLVAAGWKYESASAGSLTGDNKSLNTVPASTSTTAVVALDSSRKQMVFTFNGSKSFTMTSFGNAP